MCDRPVESAQPNLSNRKILGLNQIWQLNETKQNHNSSRDCENTELHHIQNNLTGSSTHRLFIITERWEWRQWKTNYVQNDVRCTSAYLADATHAWTCTNRRWDRDVRCRNCAIFNPSIQPLNVRKAHLCYSSSKSEILILIVLVIIHPPHTSRTSAAPHTNTMEYLDSIYVT